VPESIVMFREVSVLASHDDRHARLAFVDDMLAAVIVRLDDEAHGDLVGTWFLEAGFGCCADAMLRRPFATLDAARVWIAERYRA
jgi:hypothetical protein